MQSYIQAGDTITLAMPYDRTSGQGVKVGQVFGVCANTALSGTDNEVKTKGVFEITKVGSQAWTVGALVYWDNTNKRCTTSASGNLLIGAATVAVGAGAGETTGTVRRNGCAVADTP